MQQSVWLKVLLLLLVVTCAFHLPACSGSWPETAPEPANTSQVKVSRPQVATTLMPTVRPTSTPAPSPTPTAAPTPTPAPQPDRSAAYIYAANPGLVPVNYDSPALLPPTEDAGQAYVDKLTFICDSPTYWLWPRGLLSGGKDSKQTWTGPEGTMTLAYQGSYHILDPYDKKQKPIRDVVAQHKPEYIVIALGINGISFMKEDYFVAEYTSLVQDIQRISPKTKLILQSIYPITHKYKHYGNITNAMITAGNSWILRIAEENGCKYLDTISVLLNDAGNAKDELMLNDGLHPNTAGLELILEYIRTHAYQPPPSGRRIIDKLTLR
jgi:hypothetical protein